MDITTHRARILGPLPYLADTRRLDNIPVGPCLVENEGGQSIEIIWGARGQHAVALDVATFTSAQAQGNLVLLD